MMSIKIKTNTVPGQFLQFFFGPVNPMRLQVFRICLGISLLFYVSMRWIFAEEWLTAAGFHVPQQYAAYPSLWVPVLPAGWLPIFGILFFASIIAFILGWQLHIINWTTFLFVVYITLVDQYATFTLNKVFLISIFILACSYRKRDRKTLTEEGYVSQSAWPLRLLQLLLIMLFFLPGISKAVYGEWLKTPYVLWTAAHGTYRTEFADFLLANLPPAAWAVMQMSALSFELLCPVLFGFKGLRRFAFIWGGVFQAMIALTMQYVVFFNFQVCSFFVLFVGEKDLRKFAFFFIGPLKKKKVFKHL